MAYVVRIINDVAMPRGTQATQGDKIAKELTGLNKNKSVADGLQKAKSTNMTQAVDNVGPIEAVMDRIGTKTTKLFNTFKGGGLLASQFRQAGVAAGTASKLAAGAAVAVGVLDIANQLASNVGTFTRNKTSQNKVNNAKNITSQIAGVGGKLIAGASAGPAGLAVAVASIAVDYGIRAYNLALEIEERQIEASKASQRLGRVISTRGRD
jgi:hypothetical protein